MDSLCGRAKDRIQRAGRCLSVAAKQRAAEFGLAGPIFTDFREAIRSVPADALFDCTIPAAHKEVSSTALRTGLHVLEEKPLALTLQDAFI